MTSARTAWGWGLATITDSGDTLDVWFPQPRLGNPTEAERADTDPKVFTRVRFIYTLSGRKLKRDAVERAIHLSAEKYCSASIMLGKTAEISHEFEIVEAD